MTTIPAPIDTFSGKYIKTGLGGAGNHVLATTFYTPTAFESYPPITPQRTGIFLTGIGGAGNICSFKAQACLTSEGKASHKNHASQNGSPFHYGIGGAGNISCTEKPLVEWKSEKEYFDDSISVLSTAHTVYENRFSSKLSEIKNRVLLRGRNMGLTRK